MLLLGLLLLGSTAAFTGLLIADNYSGGPEATVTLLGNHVATMDSLRIFLSGVALALIFSLGCAMVLVAGGQARRRRSELVRVRADARRTATERDALAERLEAVDASPDQLPQADQPPVEPTAPADEPTGWTKQGVSLRRRFGH